MSANLARIAILILSVSMLISCSDNDSDSSLPDGDKDLQSEGDSDAEESVDGDYETDAETEVEIEPDYTLAPVAEWQKEREEAFLQFSCTDGPVPTSTMELMSRLECAKRWDGYDVPDSALADDVYDAYFDKLFRLKDTSDFTAMRFVNLLYAHRGHPLMSETAWSKIEDSLFNFKYWFTDPTPEREWEGEPVIDNMWYWSENHVLIFRSCEFLMGQKYPEQKFSVTGMTGAQHRERARAEIINWFQERMHWGFSEWHSDVYYNWDMIPLLSLIEWSQDPEIAFRAAQVLDLFMLDVALHLHRGNMGATHGRSYIKDKPAAVKQDVFNTAKLLFDDTPLGFTSRGATAAVLISCGKKYALPQTIRDIAAYNEPMVDRERMNPPLDERPPENWDDPTPENPLGISYTDESTIPLWWSMSAFTTWPLLPMTLEVADRYNLWEGQFKDFAMVRDLIALGGDAPPMKTMHPLYKTLYPVLGSGLLTEVNTITYRDAHVMLSSALDYRPGMAAAQAHHWQATLSESAVVFTTHPAYLPLAEGELVLDDWNWQHEDEPGPGYWTGSASRPRSAQHGTVGIHIYAPQYKPKPLGQSVFDYRKETHAYFPQAHFDEIVQEGKWTFGKKDDSFVALYSHLPTSWRDGQPEVYENDGQPFDLVAEGSAENVWIVEVGSTDGFASFEAFRQAILAASVTVTPIEDQDDNNLDDGFDVAYNSPSQGQMSFGWYGPLTVGGEEIQQSDFLRYDNPFVSAEFDSGHYEISIGDKHLNLDHKAAIREFN